MLIKPEEPHPRQSYALSPLPASEEGIKGSQRGLLPRGDAKGDSAGGKRVRERLGVSPMSDWRVGAMTVVSITNYADMILHPHSFRHTYATNLLLLGVDPSHARKLTGHQSEKAFRRYTLRSEQEAA